jgi:hypothetical protein
MEWIGSDKRMQRMRDELSNQRIKPSKKRKRKLRENLKDARAWRENGRALSRIATAFDALSSASEVLECMKGCSK